MQPRPAPASAARVDELAAEIAAARPRVDDRAQRHLLARLRQLADGEPLPPVPGDEALPESRVLRDERDRLVGVWGLSVEPTRHALDLDGRSRRLYTWCAWDALFLPELLDERATVRSRCHASGADVHVEVGPDGLGPVEPATAVVSLVPPARDATRHVTDAFCCHVHFFAAGASAAPWLHEGGDRIVLAVADAHRLARITNRLSFAHALGG